MNAELKSVSDLVTGIHAAIIAAPDQSRYENELEKLHKSQEAMILDLVADGMSIGAATKCVLTANIKTAVSFARKVCR